MLSDTRFVLYAICNEMTGEVVDAHVRAFGPDSGNRSIGAV
jgi:hypothetical protein